MFQPAFSPASPGGCVPSGRVRLVLLLAMAITAIFFARLWLLPLVTGVPFEGPDDFPSFWAGARAALGDRVAVFYQPAEGQGLLWLYPPTAFLLLWPLGLLPMEMARLAWIGLSILAAWLLSRQIAPGSRLFQAAFVLSPAAYASLYISQAGILFAALMVCALIMRRHRPVLAGILIAMLTVKPQYGLLIPVFLIAAGNWRVFVSCSLASLVFLGLSLSIHGPAPWQSMLAVLSDVYGHHAFTLDHPGMFSSAQFARYAGLAGIIPLLFQATAILTGILLVIVTARLPDLPDRLRIAALLIATGLASPYFWLYDMVLIQAALFLILWERPPAGRTGLYLIGAMILAPAFFTTMPTPAAHLAYGLLRYGFAVWFFWHCIGLGAALRSLPVQGFIRGKLRADFYSNGSRRNDR